MSGDESRVRLGEEKLPPACATARRRLSEALDGALGELDRAELEDHLSSCGPCRSAGEGLSRLRGALSALPRLALPGEDLEAVWARTVQAGRCAAPWWHGWRFAAGAAAAALAGVLAFAHRPAPPAQAELSAAELAKAQADLRLVAQLATRAVREAERGALGAALDRGVRPALRQAPVLRQSFADRSTRRD